MHDQPHTSDAAQPFLVSETEAARLLGLGRLKVWELGNHGERGDLAGIPRVRVGRRVLYDVNDLRAFIDRAKNGGRT